MSETVRNVIYHTTVDDGEFSMEVVGSDDEYMGRLIVKVVATDEVLLDQQVGLMYGAIFGPDVADVYVWEDRTIKVIDEYIAKRNEKS